MRLFYAALGLALLLLLAAMPAHAQSQAASASHRLHVGVRGYAHVESDRSLLRFDGNGETTEQQGRISYATNRLDPVTIEVTVEGELDGMELEITPADLVTKQIRERGNEGRAAAVRFSEPGTKTLVMDVRRVIADLDLRYVARPTDGQSEMRDLNVSYAIVQ